MMIRPKKVAKRKREKKYVGDGNVVKIFVPATYSTYIVCAGSDVLYSASWRQKLRKTTGSNLPCGMHECVCTHDLAQGNSQTLFRTIAATNISSEVTPRHKKNPAPQRDGAKKLLPEIFKALTYFVPKEAVPSFAENPSGPLLQQI
jgi:hypothetical protein